MKCTTISASTSTTWTGKDTKKRRIMKTEWEVGTGLVSIYLLEGYPEPARCITLRNLESLDKAEALQLADALIEAHSVMTKINHQAKRKLLAGKE